MTGQPRRFFALGTLLAVLCGGPILIAAPVPKADPREIDKLLERVPVENLGSMITQPRVAKELQLDEGQTKQLAEIWDKVGLELKGTVQAQKGAMNASGEMQIELFATVISSAKEFDAKAVSVLTRDQIRRLKQIQLQKDCPQALLNRHAMRALNPTVEQEEKMAAELAKWKRTPMVSEFVAIMTLEMEGNPMEAAGANRVLEKCVKDLDSVTEAMLKHLTADQREKWKQMTGEPVSRTDLVRAGTAFGDLKLTKAMMEAEAAAQPQPVQAPVVVPAGAVVPAGQPVVLPPPVQPVAPPPPPPPVEKK